MMLGTVCELHMPYSNAEQGDYPQVTYTIKRVITELHFHDFFVFMGKVDQSEFSGFMTICRLLTFTKLISLKRGIFLLQDYHKI